MYKSIFSLLLLILPIVANAQIKATTQDGRDVLLMQDGTWKFANQTQKEVKFDCPSLVKTSGESSASADVLWVEGASGKKAGLALVRDQDGMVNLLINPDGAGNCMQSGSAINVTYRDGSKEKWSNSAESNCNKRVSVSLGKSAKNNVQLNTLKNKEIASLNIYTKEGSIPVTLDAQQSKIFLNTLWCMTSK